MTDVKRAETQHDHSDVNMSPVFGLATEHAFADLAVQFLLKYTCELLPQTGLAIQKRIKF
jgi:hypothetical protein